MFSKKLYFSGYRTVPSAYFTYDLQLYLRAEMKIKTGTIIDGACSKCCGSWSTWIRIGFLVGWIRIQEEKITTYRKCKEISCFEVLNVLVRGLKASRLAWTDVLYKSVRISKKQFLIKKEFFCFCCIFSSIFGPWNPGSGSALTLNAKSRFALKRMGSTTLPTVQTRYLFNYP